MILETSRLHLRRFILKDIEPLYSLYSDPEIRRFYPEGTLSLAETKEELEWFLNGHPHHPELGLWATIHKATGAFIGRCGLLPWTIDGRFEVEIAYMIDRRFQGQGLATEAARGILDYATSHLGLKRLICVIDEKNTASIRVAEKIGLAFEKKGVDELGPFLLYSTKRPT